MNCLLMGNGLNRLSQQVNWHELLNKVADEIDCQDIRPLGDGMPFSLYFEELCTYGPKDIVINEINIKKKIASHLEDIEWKDLHRKYVDRFDVILTTNYDYTLEKCISPYRDKLFKFKESKYSVYRHVKVDKKVFWHLHGELLYPQSILLGYDQYVGYVNKIKNYLSELSPLSRGMRDFDKKIEEKDFDRFDWLKFSWIDHFLRDHIHIVGLGLDFTEIYIWWLLVNKARRKNVGNTYYYAIDCGNNVNERVLKLLESFNVSTHVVPASNYYEGYETILDIIEDNISSQRLFPEGIGAEYSEPEQSVTHDKVKSSQMAFPFKGKRSRERNG